MVSAVSEYAQVSEYPGFNNIAGNTLLPERVAKSPGQTVSKLHRTGRERVFIGPPPLHLLTLNGGHALLQLRAFAPVYIDLFYLNPLRAGSHSDVDTVIALPATFLDIDFDDVIFCAYRR